MNYEFSTLVLATITWFKTYLLLIRFTTSELRIQCGKVRHYAKRKTIKNNTSNIVRETQNTEKYIVKHETIS